MKPPKSYLENPKTIKANKELIKVLTKMFGTKKTFFKFGVPSSLNLEQSGKIHAVLNAL